MGQPFDQKTTTVMKSLEQISVKMDPKKRVTRIINFKFIFCGKTNRDHKQECLNKNNE